MYVINGKGEAVSVDTGYNVRPGYLVYAPEGQTHGIYDTSSKPPLQHIVLAFTKHDRAWTEKGLQ
jgi:mannose-6-phosphate isomerase-like protein (cupin superfamily)